MKKILLFLILIVCVRGLQSCTVTKEVPVKGSYLTEPYTVVTQKPWAQVWDNVIDIVAQTGIGFTTLDKSNGLLISKEYSFQGLITHEKLSGELADTSAWVVTKSLYYTVSKEYERPTLITGILTVRVKQSGEGTIININFTNFKTYLSGRATPTDSYPVKSTGVFEKKLADKLK